jgi:hypothetical protein
MSKNRTYHQKHLTGQPASAKCVHPVRQFVETGTMYVNLNDTMHIKENSP